MTGRNVHLLISLVILAGLGAGGGYGATEDEMEDEAMAFAATITIVLFVVGVILASVGGIWVIVKAFRQSVLWGVGSLLVVVWPIFVIMHWKDNKKPFFIWLAGAVLIVITNIGVALS